MRALVWTYNADYGVEKTMVYTLCNGEVAEWLKAHAWKACVLRKRYREFESHPLRHFVYYNELMQPQSPQEPASVPEPTVTNPTPASAPAPAAPTSNGLGIASLILACFVPIPPLLFLVAPLLMGGNDSVGAAALLLAGLFLLEIIVMPIAGVIALILAIVALSKGSGRRLAGIALGLLGLGLILLFIQIGIYSV